MPGNIGVTWKTTEWTATRPEENCSKMPVRGCLAERVVERVGHGAGDLDAAVGEGGGVRGQGHGGVLMAHELLQCLDVGAGRDGDGRERVAQGVEGQGAPVGVDSGGGHGGGGTRAWTTGRRGGVRRAGR